MCASVRAGGRAGVRVCLSVCLSVCARVRTRVCVRACVNVCACACACAHVCVCINSCACMCVCAYAYACVCQGCGTAIICPYEYGPVNIGDTSLLQHQFSTGQLAQSSTFYSFPQTEEQQCTCECEYGPEPIQLNHWCDVIEGEASAPVVPDQGIIVDLLRKCPQQRCKCPQQRRHRDLCPQQLAGQELLQGLPPQ